MNNLMFSFIFKIQRQNHKYFEILSTNPIKQTKRCLAAGGQRARLSPRPSEARGPVCATSREVQACQPLVALPTSQPLPIRPGPGRPRQVSALHDEGGSRMVET